MLRLRNCLCVVWVWLGLYALPANAAQYDFFGGFIPQGTPTIDGTVQTNEWNVAGKVTMSKFFGEDSQINVYFMWDTNYLYVAAEIQDYELWVDNHNPVNPWESTFNDDAFKIEIDPNRSRDTVLQTTDKVFSTTPTGAGNRFDQGNGAGSTVGAVTYGTLTNKWATSYSGTLNDYTFKTATNSALQDRGYTIEVALTWKNILSSSSATSQPDGYVLGLNPVVLENDISGGHDYAYYSAWKRVYDEITSLMGTESVPQNWAEFVISATNDVTVPATLTNLSLLAKNEYSATLGFTASGDNGWIGYARSYEVRYWTNTVTTSNWNSVFVYTNNFRPKKAGQPEVFKIIGLSPSTAYSIGVRPMDERGNTGGLATVSFSTSATNASSGQGYITVAPGSRYLAWENGTPFVVIGDVNLMTWPYMSRFYNGPMWDEVNLVYNNYYQNPGPAEAYAYLDYLRSNGVNTVRTIAEDFYLARPVTLYTNCSFGASNIVFNTNTLAFLQTYLDALATRGIGAVITPFDTFYYKTRWADNPLSTAKGGPMATADDFFNPAYIEYLKTIMRKLVETIGDRKNLIAWEFINEFDSDATGGGWNNATFNNRESTVNTLANYIRSIDSNHLVVVSSVRWDPKFSTTSVPDSALVLNNDRCHVNSTHMYYHDIRDPNYNNPSHPSSPYSTRDLDRSVAPMVRVKQGLQFYYANSLTPKPYFDTEYGPLASSTPAYDAYFTAAEDIQLFHNMIWSHLASGEVGTGIRWPGAVMDDEMPDAMRKYQLALSRFVGGGNIDYVHFSPRQIGQTMVVTNTSIPVVKTGISDGRQGMAFLVKDTRKSTAYGDVSGATLQVPGLQPASYYTFEFWDSYDSAATTAKSATNLVTDASGTAAVKLPTFAKTSAIKFFQQCSLIISTPMGAGTPGAGTNWYVPGAAVTAILTNSPVVNGATQYVCRGWVGAGSVPASGVTTSAGPFTLTNNSTLTWQWRTNFWLDVTVTGAGSLSTNDVWFSSGSNLQITATASNHWHFTQWGGDTNGCTIASNTIIGVMNNPKAISASFVSDQHHLIISTPHGQSVPAAGTNWYDYGSSNIVVITNAPVIVNGTQFVCRGWAGSGSVPVSGVTTSAGPFTLTNNSTLIWQWQTNYWLHVDPVGNGLPSTNDVWFELATNVQVTAVPDAYYAFSDWQGQTNGCTFSNNTITVVMDSPRALMVVFSEILATNDVPQWWLAQYGLTNFDDDAMSDVDGSGMLAWQKWVAGCDPTNPASVFRFTFVANSEGQNMVIRWPTASNRFYNLSRATSLLAGSNTFSILPGASNMPAMPVENSYTDSVEGVGPYFYKVDVRE